MNCLRPALAALVVCLLLACGAASASPETDRLSGLAAQGDAAALDQLIELARKKKDADAEYALGLMIYEGRGLERNHRQAFQLVERAAAQGHAEACNTLGYFHQHGIGTPADQAQAFDWYRRGAEAGSARAQTNLGWFYEQGIHAWKDPGVAATWYAKAMAQGLAGAHANLARLYESGLGVEKNPVVAIALYEAAFSRGLTSAALSVARLQEARGNVAEATDHYVAAAKAGMREAEFPAGRLLVAAANPRRNAEQGVHWLSKAAVGADGRDVLEPLLVLATLYDKGEGLPADPVRAAGFFRRAAELGHAESAFRYGAFLEAPTKKPAPGGAAAEDPAPWFRRAAEKGHADAQFRLARLVQPRGEDGRKEAAAWYRKAAEQGHLPAALQLAIALEGGSGVARAPAEAITWYGKAAAAGDAEALYRLGNLYDRGIGTAADFGRARDYYTRAAALGHAEAAEILKKMVGAPTLEKLQGDPFKGMR